MKKKIRKLWNNRILQNYLILMVSFLIIEIIFRAIEHMPIIHYASLRILLGLSILALFFGYILSFLPKIIAKVGNIFLVLIASIYSILELGFHNFLGVYASVGTNTQLGAVTSYIGDFLSSFKWTYFLLLIPLIFLFLYYLLLDKKVNLDLPKLKKTKIVILKKLIPVVLLLCFGALYYGSLKASFMQDKTEASSAYEIFLKPTNASLAIRNFGILGYGLLDIKEYLFPGDVTHTIEIDPDSIQSELEISVQSAIDNDTWLGLIEEESDEELNTLNKYFISNDASTTNEYTGLLEGKNVIVIMVESGNDILFNEEYYPNIARLAEHGYTFTNNYSPRNICSTGNNEMSAMISLYSINNNCTANVYQDNTYFESIFNLFKDAGYSTNSFHGHYDQYYARDVIHKNMGSDAYYNAVDLDLDFKYSYGSWASDEELMENYLEYLAASDLSQPFMSFITTVTSHQPYNGSGYGNTYALLFPEEYPQELKYYMSKLKVVDNAIGILLDGLDDLNILDDTVIVLFGDHYPYAIEPATLNLELDYDAGRDSNADQVPLIIYNSQLESKEFLQYTSYITLTPTLANLFDLKFDSRLYMGLDALSREYDSLVVFPDGSWKNENAYYNASTNEINYYTENMYTDEEILAINSKVRLKLEMSSLAIRRNYFSYLENALNNNTTSSE